MSVMSTRSKFLKGSVSNIIRVILSAIVALVLPPLFVRHMSPPEYGAWILIVQCSSYIAILDFGLQTAIGKFVAEYDAINDRTASSDTLSNSVAILCFSSVLGAVITLAVSWQVPQLFHQMPSYLIHPLRIGILFVGLAACFALPFNAFLAVFVGLQRYGFPAAVAIASKVASSIALITFLLLHASLAQLAWLLALLNVATALAQFAGWRRYARDRVDFSIRLISARSIASLARYGTVVSIWTLAMLLISGTDLFIVGHFDYGNTGYYGIASNATNFLLLLLTSLFSPLLPAVSGMSSTRTPRQIGEITTRFTRYCVIAICALGLPLLMASYPLLQIWVGTNYATRCAVFLNILVLGNAVRMMFYPYTVVVVATGTQHLATISAIAEALVNFGLSLYLVHQIGASGVAVGTVVGAFVGVTLHFTVSMARTSTKIEVSRRRFGLEGLARQLMCTIPSVAAALVFQKSSSLVLKPWLLAAWAIATLALIWWVGLNCEERAGLWRRL